MYHVMYENGSICCHQGENLMFIEGNTGARLSLRGRGAEIFTGESNKSTDPLEVIVR